MGITGRIGDVLRSYLNGGGTSSRSGGEHFSDPDLAEAFNELNDFLNDNKFSTFDSYSKNRTHSGANSNTSNTSTSNKSAQNSAGFYSSQNTQKERAAGTPPRNMPPEELRADFAELGVPFGASEDDCRNAYKKLVKIHHPDRHAGHEGNQKKATAKLTRINTAYGRIDAWRKKHKPEAV